jgi:hypothetical protein
MIVLYIDSTPLVVGGAIGVAGIAATPEGELRPATIIDVPETVGCGEECDGTAADALILFRIVCSCADWVEECGVEEEMA